MSKQNDPVGALAEAWAAIDGNLEEFRVCQKHQQVEEILGRHEGYRADAQALIEGLNKRGYTVILQTAATP